VPPVHNSERRSNWFRFSKPYFAITRTKHSAAFGTAFASAAFQFCAITKGEQMPESINTDPHHSDLSVVEARQGIMFGRMRYVLAISTIVAIAALFTIMAFFYWP
jgi:hypothetical protein